MSERAIITERIRRKEAEVHSLERKLEAAKVYLQALNDVLGAIEKQTGEGDPVSSTALRKGSAVAQANEIIRVEGAPLHIDEILSRMGKEATREAKASLTSSLAAYVRRGEIFSRPAPNTFGLIEMGHHELPEEASGPPEGFGSVAHAGLDDESPF